MSGKYDQASLIAAAPELLSCLVAFCAFDSRDYSRECDVAKALLAIKKASWKATHAATSKVPIDPVLWDFATVLVALGQATADIGRMHAEAMDRCLPLVTCETKKRLEWYRAVLAEAAGASAPTGCILPADRRSNLPWPELPRRPSVLTGAER